MPASIQLLRQGRSAITSAHRRIGFPWAAPSTRRARSARLRSAAAPAPALQGLSIRRRDHGPLIEPLACVLFVCFVVMRRVLGHEQNHPATR